MSSASKAKPPKSRELAADSRKPYQRHIDSDEDEEIRKAKAMALAIQKNPSLSAGEIQKLVGQSEQSQLIEKKKDNNSKMLLIPGRLASAFQNIKDDLDPTVRSASAPKSVPAPKANPAPNSLPGEKTSNSTTPDAKTEPAKKMATSQRTETPPKVNKGPKMPSVLQDIRTTFLKDDSANKDIKDTPREKARLSAVLWKRRSGLGKLSATKAWEKRRVVVRGSVIEYYNTEADLEDDEDENQNENENEGDNMDSNHVAREESSRRQNWFEQAGININNMTPFANMDDPNAPRGMLDLIKERATVAAATGHSNAPTPFAISVKVKGETKWKFCFESHAMQMEWLITLTDVVVTESVDYYNSQLLQAADPNHEGSMFQNHTNPMPPPAVDSNDNAKNRLWMLEDYDVKSRNGQQLEDEEREENEKDEMGEARVLEIGNVATVVETTVDWGFQGMDLYLAIILFNLALMFARAGVTSTQGFWHVVAFSNITLWIVMLKEQKKSSPLVVGGTDRAQSGARSVALDPKAANRSETKNSKPTKPVEPAFKPKAGTTTLRIENPTDSAVKDGITFAGWRAPAGEELMVRSHGYLSSKKKIQSPGTLYELVNCDIFEGPKRYPDMATRVQLPKVKFENDSGPKTWSAPDVFVISVSLPTDPPKLTKSSDDGGGYTITMYYTMRQETRDILRRITSSDYDPSKEIIENVQKNKVNAVKLFDEWCRRSPSDPKFMARFKLIVNAQNLKEIGVPGWIAKYNGKPVLIKRPGQTGFLYTHPELSCVEFDISLHPFPYLAKQGICFLKEHFFQKVLVIFGFVIEGRSNDELPECVIGLMQLCYPNPAHAIQAKDVFAGTSPKSF